MPAITLKNIPNDLYDQIKKSAEVNYRSLNAEILFRLRQTLGTKPISAESLFARINDLNKRVHLPLLTDEFLTKAKNEGRE